MALIHRMVCEGDAEAVRAITDPHRAVGHYDATIVRGTESAILGVR